MKNLVFLLLLLPAMAEAQVQIPLGQTYYCYALTHSPSTGALAAADSTPTYEVLENGTDASIITGSLVARTGVAITSSEWTMTFNVTAANGFESRKYYAVRVAAAVESVSDKQDCPPFTVSGLQIFVKGEAFPAFGIFMHKQGQAGNIGYTGGTLSCLASTNNGSGFGAYSGTGISNQVEIGNGTYSVDLDNTVIGDATWLRCTATGGSGNADIFLQEIFGQK